MCSCLLKYIKFGKGETIVVMDFEFDLIYFLLLAQVVLAPMLAWVSTYTIDTIEDFNMREKQSRGHFIHVKKYVFNGQTYFNLFQCAWFHK